MNGKTMEGTLNEITRRYVVRETVRQRDDLIFLTLERKEDAIAVMTMLKEVQGFTHLVFLTAVDYIERGVFTLQYLLHSYTCRGDIGVKVEIDRKNPVMESIDHLWAQACTYQRELKEMFGIEFPGSPGLNEPFVLEGWDGPPPMRRDFDTRKYSEETFFPRPGRSTRDPAEHMREKLYPAEGK